MPRASFFRIVREIFSNSEYAKRRNFISFSFAGIFNYVHAGTTIAFTNKYKKCCFVIAAIVADSRPNTEESGRAKYAAF